VEKGRPVVHLFGKLDTGQPFLVRDDREIPHFYVRETDADRARGMGATPLAPTGKVALGSREAVARVEIATPPDTPPLRDRLVAAGIPCFEADVPFATRYLIDRGLRGSVEIDGDPVPRPRIGVVFDQPSLSPGDWTPTLGVLSLDIETDPQGSRLLSVGLVGCGAEEVLLLHTRRSAPPERAVPFRSERELLRAMVERVREIDPDVLTGWNLIDFDLTVLSRFAERAGVTLDLGRGPGRIRLMTGTGRGPSRAILSGRMVLDGIHMLRGAFVRLDDYSLNGVSREVLGKGKTITGSHRGEAILRSFETDLPHFVEYNLTDCRLVLEILDKLQLIELAVERSRLTGMPLDRVGSSIASFDFLYLMELGPRGVVAPTVRFDADHGEPTAGGYVLEPEPGLYRNVLVFDFKSLYPSIIRTFQIDPLGRLPDDSDDPDPIVAPGGAAFRREPGILTGILDQLVPRREQAKREGDEVASQAIKILMNSFYGVLGTSACRFHDPALANAITGFGRELLLWSKARIESYGHRVLYGDTDSLFVMPGENDPSRATSLGRKLVTTLNRDLTAHLREKWKVESRLELEFETIYLRLLLPAVRHGTAGARKRYAGLVDDAGRHRVVFTGMEVVRRDWTELAKRVQRELYERLFSDRAVEEYLAETVARLRAGKFDDQLVYRKALRKSVDAYTSTTPPHVAAARKMKGRPPRVIRYVMTAAGAEPSEQRENPLDYEHYVQKQVRPVAEPVLGQLGLDFDRVVGDDTQLTLF
jgi:DNA polymerase-2